MTPTTVPDWHPARALAPADGQEPKVHLDYTLTNTTREESLVSLTDWHAVVTARGNDHQAPVATADVVVVDPTRGNPRKDLAQHSLAAAELGAPFFRRNGKPSRPFAAITKTNGGPVLLLSTFRMTDDWRGTALTPIIAVRMLAQFARLGADTAGLYAGPILDDRRHSSKQDIQHAAARIAAMWEQVGFTYLRERRYDMGMALTGTTLDQRLASLSGTDPVLREAARPPH